MGTSIRRSARLAPAAAVTILLGACATIPTPLQGQFAAITPDAAARAAPTATDVRWGGKIIKVEPKADSTCFEILGRPLDSSARPSTRGASDGRFIACRDGFYDPEVFEPGKDVTVVGRLTGNQQGKVGEFEYTYPHVAATAIYLWPDRPTVIDMRSPYGPWYSPDPFWWGYPGWWGWGPYYPGVIVVPSASTHAAPSTTSAGGKH